MADPHLKMAEIDLPGPLPVEVEAIAQIATNMVLRDVTAWWKDNRDWLMRADILRLDTVDHFNATDPAHVRQVDRIELTKQTGVADAQPAIQRIVDAHFLPRLFDGL